MSDLTLQVINECATGPTGPSILIIPGVTGPQGPTGMVGPEGVTGPGYTGPAGAT
jgi:hypothetical protein